MIDLILDNLGLVRKSKIEKKINFLRDIIDGFRNELWEKEKKELELKKEIIELKDINRKLESEFDRYDFQINLANNKLIKKDKEIEKLKLENRYYKNRNEYVALNNNIAFGLSNDLLEINTKGEEQ